MQVSPGAYDENAFQALDLVIAEAEKKGLRVILSLVDNWKYEGGVDEFVDWAKTVPARDKKYPVATGGDGDVNDMVGWSRQSCVDGWGCTVGLLSRYLVDSQCLDGGKLHCTALGCKW